ncbi:MAG: anthranilate synthase component I, partial [Lachnospiraceae bacterium]|nr:anthranilate synthase component I [Lachnospiraceae bacterium]
MIPTMESIKEIKEKTGCKRVPVYETIYSDSVTPVEVIRRIRGVSKHCYLLESASQTESWGRYSFLGYEPSMEITCQDGKMIIRKLLSDGSTEISEEKVTHPGKKLREILAKYKSPKLEGLPTFTGGLVGYFSYDYIKYAEPKLKLSSDADFKD